MAYDFEGQLNGLTLVEAAAHAFVAMQKRQREEAETAFELRAAQLVKKLGIGSASDVKGDYNAPYIDIEGVRFTMRRSDGMDQMYIYGGRCNACHRSDLLYPFSSLEEVGEYLYKRAVSEKEDSPVSGYAWHACHRPTASAAVRLASVLRELLTETEGD